MKIKTFSTILILINVKMKSLVIKYSFMILLFGMINIHASAISLSFEKAVPGEFKNTKIISASCFPYLQAVDTVDPGAMHKIQANKISSRFIMVNTGYDTIPKKDLIYSVSNINSADIKNMPVDNIQRALQGRAAGLRVTSNSGIPGGFVSIAIRGTRSFYSNAPLWIIDGMPVRTGGISSISASDSKIASLDFNDFESVDILKDDAATAIYGARGANGVIIVTTKRGRSTEKTGFSFYINRGFTQAVSQKPVMNGMQWAQWDTERYANRFGVNSFIYQSRIELGNSRGWYELDENGMPDFSTTPNYSWQDEVHRQGELWQARLSARGGNEKTRFFTSVTHSMMEGHITNYDFSRSGVRVNLDHQANEKLSFDSQINTNFSRQSTTRYGSFWSSPVYGSAALLPVEPIYDEESNFFNAPRSVWGSNTVHVPNSMKYDYKISKNITSLLNLSASYKPGDNFTYRASLGIDAIFNDDKEWLDPRAADGASANGLLSRYRNNYYAIQVAQTISYNQVFKGVHSIRSIAGHEFMESNWSTIGSFGANFTSPNINLISSALNAYGSENEYEQASMGFFSRLSYAYNDRYLISLTGRYDASSRFGEHNRWQFFPAVAVGWRISSEQFMSNTKNIDNLMIRVSYGESGWDAAGAYTSLGLWRPMGQYMGLTGIIQTNVPNVYLTSELSRTLNLATTVEAFNGRFNLNIDLFRRQNEKLLMGRSLASSVGFSYLIDNIGKTINEGLELSLNTININRLKLRWITDFNISFIQGEITQMLPGEETFSSRRRLGQAINDRQITMWAGVNVADGRPMYYDKDGKITYNPTYNDRDWMGPHEPRIFGGIGNNLQFGNLEASLFFQFSGGNYLYLQEMLYFFNHPGNRNQFDWVWTERWVEPGDIAQAPRPNYNNSSVRSPSSYASHMIQRADYIRLKDASISYNLQSDLLQQYGVDNIKIILRGINLHTWTGYPGADPETNITDFGTYPQSKSIVLGLSTNF